MTSVVYFLRGEKTGAIKIGTTKRMSARMSNIATSAPEPVVLIGSVRGDYLTEKVLHDEFADSRIHGEWFKPTEALLSRISTLIETLGDADEPKTLKLDDKYTKTALKWLVAIENGASDRRLIDKLRTRKALARRMNCSLSLLDNLRYGRKNTPISVRDYEALRLAYIEELEAQADELREIIKTHKPVVDALAAETQLAKARELLTGEVK